MKSSILFSILLVACVTEVIFALSDLQDAKSKVQNKKAAVKSALNDVRGNKLSLQLKTVSQLAVLKYNTTENLMNLIVPERYDAKAKLDVASPSEKNYTTTCYEAVYSVLNDLEVYVANHADKLEKRANEVIREMMKVFDENEVDGEKLLDKLDEIIPSCVVDSPEKENCVEEAVETLSSDVGKYTDNSLLTINKAKLFIEDIIDDVDFVCKKIIEDTIEDINSAKKDVKSCLENKSVS